MTAFSTTDHRHMAEALRLAEKGLYTTDPNPRVGCVLAHGETVVGRGWHQRAGEPHAEVHALSDAGDKARGATVYVTLEPCSHHGRTPPCADALIEADVARVVVAGQDPNPQVGGSGIERLRQAGVQVDVGLMNAQAEALNPGFMQRHRMGRPYMRIKMASSLDGRIAVASGESQWITGEPARRDGHLWRARSSAVLTGIGTVLADDPRLDVRHLQTTRQPARVVLDSQLRLSPTAAMLNGEGGPCHVIHACDDQQREQALTARGVQPHAVNRSEGGLDLTEVMQVLNTLGFNEVLVEAGPTLAGALLQAALVDEVLLYQADTLLGHQGWPLLTMPGIERMSDRVDLYLVDERRLGDDRRLIFIPRAAR